MHIMGIEAIYPKKNQSRSDTGHQKFPYLLKELDVNRPDQVWATDITYIRIKAGFMYLEAVMGWFSRYVLPWRLSNGIDTGFCIEALEEAVVNRHPEIYNSEQGSQFTSDVFICVLHGRGICMGGKGNG